MAEELIDIYTFTWNEEFLAPFILQYWKLLPVRKVFVIDNESTDNTVNILKTWNKVEIINRKSNNTFDDIDQIKWKNNVWKQSREKVPFVIVSDFDEIIFCPNIVEKLKFMIKNNFCLLSCSGVELICKELHKDDNKLIHEFENMKFNYYDKNHNNRKKILFNPNSIIDINYDVGAHKLHPYVINDSQVLYDNNIFLFHIKFITLQYMLNRYKIYRQRLSDNNKKFNLGGHYVHDDKYLINDFEEKYKSSLNYDDVIKECLNINLNS